MTIPYIKSGGWAYKEKLTSTQMNTLQTTLVERCADVQGTCDVSSAAKWTFNNLPKFTGGIWVLSGFLDLTSSSMLLHIRKGTDGDTSYNGDDAAIIRVPTLTANRTWTLTVDSTTQGGSFVLITAEQPYPTSYYVNVVDPVAGHLAYIGGSQPTSVTYGLFAYAAGDGVWIPVIRT
jgi:hypothetical protein